MNGQTIYCYGRIRYCPALVCIKCVQTWTKCWGGNFHATMTSFRRMLKRDIPYGAYISRVFNFINFANLESFAKLFQQKFQRPH